MAGIFGKIVYELTLLDLENTTWLVKFENSDFDLIVIVTATGMVINGILQGYNWLTDELSKYFAQHMEDSW